MKPYYSSLPVITFIVLLKWNSWMLYTCIFQLMVFPLSLPALAWHCDDNSDEEEEGGEEDNDGDVDGMPDGASRQLNPVALASVSSSLSPNVLEALQEGSQKVFIWNHLSWRTPGGYLPDKSQVWAPLKQSAVLRNHCCLTEGLQSLRPIRSQIVTLLNILRFSLGKGA